MRVLAIDPGTNISAVLIWDCIDNKPHEKLILENRDIPAILKDYPFKTKTTLAVEMVASYGMPVGREVFETCVWIGRFVEAWQDKHSFVYRRDVKLHFCGSNRAKDPNIRQALIDRFGIVGTKKNPGMLYGIASHLWSALAVAVFYADQQKTRSSL